MLKKFSALMFLGSLCLWAADFWASKPFTEWSDNEVKKILQDSPWTGKVTIRMGGVVPPPLGGGGGGPRGGPQGDGGDAGASGGAGGFGGGGEVTATLVWQTALPI